MGEVIDLGAKVKKYYKFSRSELKGVIITILVIAFVISFKEWGSGEEVQIATGLFNFFNAVLIVLISFLFHDFAIKVAALSVGHRAEYKMWIFGLIIAIILAFATNGKLWFLIPGGVILHHLAGHRLGFFRYGLNYFGLGLSVVTGPLASITLALIFKSINSFASSALIHKAVIFNIWYAIFTILPIPPADGSRMLYGSRWGYFLFLALVVSAALLIYADVSILVTIFGSIIIAIVCWLLYYILFEHRAWKGPYPK